MAVAALTSLTAANSNRPVAADPPHGVVKTTRRGHSASQPTSLVPRSQPERALTPRSQPERAYS